MYTKRFILLSVKEFLRLWVWSLELQRNKQDKTKVAITIILAVAADAGLFLSGISSSN